MTFTCGIPLTCRGLAGRLKTVYPSALHDISLERADPPFKPGWNPLSWTVEARSRAKDAPIDPQGSAFPVIVFSHGSTNDPIDYAHTLEWIAAAGFVVAAPYHVNNTQDDVRIDFINDLAKTRLFDCRDGLVARAKFGPGDCSKSNVPFNMADRVRDIRYILDALPGWFVNRVDVSRTGVLGHSRGTVTALAAAGGSVNWTAPDPNDPNVPNCQSHDDAVAHAGPGENLLCWPLSPDPASRRSWV